MAKLTVGDKATRVLKMIVGMRNAQIGAAMAPYGFTNADLEEGWTLLQGIAGRKLAISGHSQDPSLLMELDAWEKRWFPIAEATLERHFPAVHAQVFNNLSRTTGPAVAIGVSTFIGRFDQMAVGTGTYGAEGVAAKTMLEGRGLTAAVVNDARSLLASMATIATGGAGTTVDQEQEEAAKAEEAMWSWYLEWSQIARVAISQRALLKQMGFGATPHPKAPAPVVVAPGTGNGVDPHAPPVPVTAPATPH